MAGKIIHKELDIAARTVWGESRGEPFLGQVAVAWTIRNRVQADIGGDGKPDWWGEGYIAVCLKPWQFSCWNKDDANYEKAKAVDFNSSSYCRSFSIMALVMAGDLPDPTNGATHYYAKYIAEPHWARGQEPVAEIGVHRFYRMV